MEIKSFETHKKEWNCEGCLNPNDCVECYLDSFNNSDINEDELYEYFVDNYRKIKKELYGEQIGHFEDKYILVVESLKEQFNIK